MTIRVIASGQSNMVGRGVDGPPFAGVSSLARFWNNVNPLGANGTAFVTAAAARTAGTFENQTNNNLAVWFAHRLAQVMNEQVDLTMVARGATAISGWAPGNPIGMLQEMIDVWAATGQGAAHVFIWHQGEGNVTDSYSSYNTSFQALLTNLTAAGIINSSTIIILGGLSEDNSDRINFNANVLAAMAANYAQIYFAPSDGLTSFDGTHFDGQSLFTHGAARFSAAYLEARGLTLANLYTLINDGGTPGSPGTGVNKLYDLIDLALIGLRTKDVTTTPAFTGTMPVDHLLTAAMAAAASVVEYGVTANGIFMKQESGLMDCWIRATMTFSSSSLLSYAWTFPGGGFISAAMVVAIPQLTIASNNFSGAKRGGSILTSNGNALTATNIRMESNALYTGGDETCGFTAHAKGFWK